MKFLTNIWERIEAILKEKFLFVLGITFFNYIPYGINRYFLGKYLYSPLSSKFLKFSFSFVDFFMLILGLFLIFSFFSNRIKNIFYNFLFYISLSLFIIEIFLFKTFKSLINPAIIQILLETNTNEAVEFLQTYIDIKLIFLIFFIILLFYFSIKILKKKISIDENKLFKSNIIKFILIIFPIVKIFSISSDSEIFNVIRFINSVRVSAKNIKEYKEVFSNIDKNNISIISDNSKIKNIVLILGESTTRNHMSLYNYPVDTNPLLKKLEADGNLYKFTDTISPHSHTIPNIKKIFTFYNFESDKEWYKYNNIIDILKLANYNTYWFSNQESSGIFGNVSAALSKRCELTLFNNVQDSSNSEILGAYDEQIIDKSLKHINSEKNFIVYHLLGTHSKYRNRYPQDFEIFKNDNQIIAEYDNAVLYNDYIVNKIISNFKDKEAIVIYISDHGEEVYDFRNFVGHAEDKGSRYMIEIPFLIYLSDKFKENYPETVKKIAKSLNNPYMTDDLIHTILDIAEIETEEFDETRSIINENFNSSRKRIFSEKNYDSYWKNRD